MKELSNPYPITNGLKVTQRALVAQSVRTAACQSFTINNAAGNIIITTSIDCLEILFTRYNDSGQYHWHWQRRQRLNVSAARTCQLRGTRERDHEPASRSADPGHLHHCVYALFKVTALQVNMRESITLYRKWQFEFTTIDRFLLKKNAEYMLLLTTC